jgi:tellurite resistance protein
VELFRAAIAQTGGGGAWAKARAVRAKGITAATVSEEDDAIIAYVEAAAAAVYYVCTMDDAQEMDQDEQDALVEALGEMLGYEAHEDEIDKLLARWGQYIEADEEGFLAEVAETLRDERAFRETLQLAVVVAAADGELSPPEEAAAYELGHAFGFDDDTCERIIARALRKLG